MSVSETPNTQVRPRLWPAVVIVAFMWALMKIPPRLSDEFIVLIVSMMWGPIAGVLLFLLWWLFFSRVGWRDRWILLGLCAAIGAVAFALFHPSVGGMALFMFALPAVVTAWLIWLLVTPSLKWGTRCAGLCVVFVAVWGYFTTLRFDGVTGAFDAQLSYRWNQTDEEKFIAERAKSKPGAAPRAAATLVSAPGDWTGFRGEQRDSRLPGMHIPTDWAANPPKLLWKHRIGPGWSSFAVVGNRLFTQEQRDQDEVVACYDADTGTEIWAHSDKTRFDEPVAGPGPRATPTFHDGKIYAMGGSGRLNCLDAATGKLNWTRDVLKDSGAKLQEWGYAASPLVHQGIVSVYGGGPDDKAVLGYKADTGDVAWTGGKGKHSYCSLQLSKLNGVDQLLIATDAGLTSFEPVSGKVLWHDEWDTGGQIARIVQPAVIGDSDVILGTPFEKGTRRVHVNYDGSNWTPDHKWESLAFKPYYNDFVVHNGHLYGFNGSFLICFGLDDQKIKWKERGYGNGQVLLLPDQNLLVVLTEKGEVALVPAEPAGSKEIARIPAIAGKTWNHPVIAHGRLYVRNGAEMACFELEPKKPDAPAK